MKSPWNPWEVITSRIAPETLTLQCGALRSISLRTMAYDVPHAPATEEAQGPLEATLSCFSELTSDMISTPHLPSSMVALYNIPRHSRESDYMEFLGKNSKKKKTPSGACAPLCDADFILACRAKFLILFNMIRSMISDPIPVRSKFCRRRKNTKHGTEVPI